MGVKPPNVLLFIMDDQTPFTIRALGNHDISTPNLDRLMEQGCFGRPHTTVPVCTPARGELLTGRNAFRNGCRWFGEPLDPDIMLLPQALGNAGYHCCHIGKWHNDGHPRDRGYHETHLVTMDDLKRPYTGHDVVFDSGGVEVRGHSTELFCGQAAEFVRTAPRDRPWCCYVALHSPHDPRTAPQPWASMYDACLPPLPPNYMPEHPFDNGDMMIRDERLAGFPRRHDEIRRHRGDYYAMISHHDHWIGTVLHALETTGQTERTLIVFTSDHGLAVGCHGLMGKESLYEHSVRVPLIFSGPDLPRGRRFDESCLCGHYDFMPTLMEYLGLAAPDTCEGVSYLNAVTGGAPTVRQDICAGYRDCMRMARDGRFKLLYYPHIDRTQLFDIANDPDETNDLMTPWRRHGETRVCPPPATPETGVAYEPDRELKQKWLDHLNPIYTPRLPADEVDGVVARLRQVLARWQEEMDDPVPRVAEV